MNARDEAPHARDLRACHRWLRALAMRLALDEHVAEDAVQETWLRALREKRTPPRAWLSRVLRSRLRDARTSEERRRRRETDGEVEEPSPTDDLVARAEWQRHLVNAVLALPEPHRTTILLRFFEERRPRWIAREMNAPVETVRTRIRRGLTLLREHLTQQHGEWRPGLVSCGLASSSAGTFLPTIGSFLLMNTAWKIGALVLVGIGTSLWWSNAPSDPHERSPMHPRAEGSRTAEPSTSHTSTRVARTAPALGGPRSNGISLSARISESGRPLAHRSIALRAEVHERVRIPGGLRHTPRTLWKHEVMSDEGGRFSVEALPASTPESVIHVEVTGYLPARRGLGSVAAGDAKDLGDFQLEPVTSLRVRILDRDDRPLTCGFEVEVRRTGPDVGTTRCTDPLHAEESGPPWFVLPGLPLGPSSVTVHFPLLGWKRTQEIDLVRDGPNDLTFHYTGIDPWRTLSLVVLDDTYHLLTPRPRLEHVHVRDATGAEHASRRPWANGPPPIEGAHRFESLPLGPLTLTVDYPGFHPVVRHALVPGPTVHRVALVGSTSLRISVMEEGTGELVEHYGLGWRQFDQARTSSYQELLLPEDRPEGRCELDGLKAGPYELAVLIEGRSPEFFRVEDLREDEVREVVVRVRAHGTIRGRVIRAGSGRPVTTATVALFLPAAMDDASTSEYATHRLNGERDPNQRREHSRTRVDEEGTFRFENVPTGRYHVVASEGDLDSGSVRDLRENVFVSPTEPTTIELSLGEPATLRGRLRLPDGYTLDGDRLQLGQVDARIRVVGACSEVQPDPGGDFELHGLAPGEYDLWLASSDLMTRAHLRRIELLPGPNHFPDFDPGPNLPAFVQWTFDMTGPPPERRPVLHLRSDGRIGCSGELDEEGRSPLLRVFPGIWNVSLSGEGWIQEIEASLEVSSASRIARQGRIEFSTRDLTFLEAPGGAPWRRERFEIHSVHPHGRTPGAFSAIDTDETGKASVTLPHGEYLVRRGAEGSRESVRLIFPTQPVVMVPHP